MFDGETRSPFEYPTGLAPRFDPSHIASKNAKFSFIARANGGIDLLTGRPGTVVGACTATCHAGIGPGSRMAAAGRCVTFANMDGSNFSSATYAAIIQISAGSTYQDIIGNVGGNGGSALGLDSSDNLNFNISAVTNKSAAVGVTVDTPYFVLASRDGTAACVFATLNLRTGKLTTQTATGTSAPNAPNGTYVVGVAGDLSSFPLLGSIACGMISSAFMSEAQVRLWAKNPWSFWYQ